jgi:hypothetical protein
MTNVIEMNDIYINAQRCTKKTMNVNLVFVGECSSTSLTIMMRFIFYLIYSLHMQHERTTLIGRRIAC